MKLELHVDAAVPPAEKTARSSQQPSPQSSAPGPRCYLSIREVIKISYIHVHTGGLTQSQKLKV